MMQGGRQPQTYQEWLNELNNSTQQARILECAVSAAKLAPSPKVAFHDAALVLANMYKREMNKAADNPVLERTIKSKFDTITQKLFQGPMSKVLEHVIATEPSFDPQASGIRQGTRGALGYINPPHKDGKSSLGFL